MRSKGILVAIMLLALHAMAAAQQPDNLLKNGSAEDGIKYWTMVAGNTWGVRSKNPDPKDGFYYFFAGTDGATELHQVVDVSHLAPTIDANRQVFEFIGYVRSYPQTPPTPNDVSKIWVEYLNAAGTRLWWYYSPSNTDATQWRLVTNTRLAPPGTRRIRVRLAATRQAYSGNNDGYFDFLSLTTRVCDCVPCQYCGLDGICRPNFDLNGKSCERFSQDQVLRIGDAIAGVNNHLRLTIDKSCGKGTCQDGQCILPGGQSGFSRWEAGEIRQAAEGAVATIFAPPFGYCLQDPLRQTMQQNLGNAGGFRVQCINSPYCNQAFGGSAINAACACTTPDYPGVIALNNQSYQDCAQSIQTVSGTPSPSLEDTFEKTLFHELVHDKGGLGHTGDYATDRTLACDKACYGFETQLSAENFTKINPENCKYP